MTVNENLALSPPETDLESMLQYVKSIIRDSIDTGEKTLKEMALYFAQSQGKLLRPTLTLACGLICKGSKKLDLEELYFTAAGVEMLHMSALVHDDIIDRAEMRRGKPTINAIYGSDMALLLGDYFYSRALSLMSNISDISILEQALSVIARMVEGEVKQKEEAFDTGISLKDYLTRIARKTASLTAFSCFAGARVARLAEKEVKALVRFGEYFGKAYQIRDDILDFLKNEHLLKKPASDLHQGIFTLPMVIYLKENRLESEHPIISPRQVKSLYEKCIKSGAVSRSILMCNNYLDKSMSIIKTFTDNPIRYKMIKTLQKIYI
ncbi:MAG TPA: polyprenyl synthetase family protein [Thermoanaerobacterales bacterium]|nr:polyprenyl synthetase family protein [Thermoanaerobacterales bacterium]